VEIQLGKKKIGCAPGLGSLVLVALGALLLASSYLYLGPASSEARGFVSALRHGDTQAAEELTDPTLVSRLHRAFLERRMDEPIASLAGGDGPHSWHVSFAKGERCFRFTGQADREIFVVLRYADGQWLVTQVSFYERDAAVCGEN
jgi:hypothetical protein